LGEGALPPGQDLTTEIVRALLWIAAITAVASTAAVGSYRRITT
jgi:hypothetical protein